jgi:hypothetical protein
MAPTYYHRDNILTLGREEVNFILLEQQGFFVVANNCIRFGSEGAGGTLVR